jgi:hypothetical protein
MKTRKLLTGKRVKALEHAHNWSFESKCPAKWLHIDCEEGKLYVANHVSRGNWLEPTVNQVDAALKALKDWKALRPTC